jgi:ABC-type lipoprotein release transport system permease subunit
MVARTLRQRLRGSLVVIAVVAGVAGGIATGLVSGAERTATAAERFLAESHVLDVMVSEPNLTVEQAEQVRRVPGVRAAALLSGVTLFARDGGFLNLVASVDGHWGIDHDLARLVRGRTPEPDSPDEIVLGEAVADHLGVDVGDVVTFDSWSPEQVEAMQTDEDSEDPEPVFLGPTLELRVVGISRHPTDLVTSDPAAFFTALPPGVWNAYQGKIGEFGFRFITVDLGLDPSADQVAALAEAVRPIVGPRAAFEDAGEQGGQPVLATLDFVAGAMVVLAGAVAVGGLILAGLLLARTMTRAAEDLEALRPLGMTGADRARAATVAALPAAIIAGVLASAVAVAAAAFMPFGLAARAEPDPGLFIDAAVVAIGAGLTALLVVALASATAARRMARASASSSAAPVGIVSRLSSRRLPVGALCGVDLALGTGRGGRRSAARSASRTAIAGVALATIAGVGALVLGTSVDQLVDTPKLFGWTWDYTTEAGAAQLLADDPSVESVGLVNAAAITIDGRPVTTRGIASLKGELPLTLIDGRPAQAGEVVLGTRTMDDLGVGIGDTVVASGTLPPRELRVVGRAVFAGVVDAPEAGWGAAVPLDEFEKLGIEGDNAEGAVVALVDGADRAAFKERLEGQGLAVQEAEEPLELDRLREVKGFPWVLTAFLVVVGLMATAHAIFVTGRRRRSDLAVLRAMGLARRGLYQALSVQAATLALAGLLIGIPLGVIAGRVLWRSVARPLGVIVAVDVPWPAIIGAGVLACLLLAGLALVPARRLARTKPANALRAE